MPNPFSFKVNISVSREERKYIISGNLVKHITQHPENPCICKLFLK